MYCSNKQFIDIAKATGVDEHDLSAMLATIVQLVQRRGSLVKSTKLHGLIEQEAPQIAHMMQLLGDIDKLDSKSLKGLLSEVQTAENNHFTIRAQKMNDALQQKLEKQFGKADVEVITTEASELQVAGNGRWYKRSLEKDLEKILG